MERVTQVRTRILLALFGLLLCIFAFRLYVIQVYETGGQVDNTTVYVTQTRVKAARGELLDTNGNVLVGNRASYDLIINHYVIRGSEAPNASILALVKKCQALDISYADHFPISVSRPFAYTLDEYNSSWQDYFQVFLRERGELDSDISATLLIQKLRESYQIPEEWSDEDARLVIGLRYELSLRDYTNLPNYVFISDASDEELSAILELNTPGLRVEPSTVREYYTEYAAHILGFVGAMDADQWEYYKQLGGYSMDAEVGQSGFEKAFEEYLHGTDGIRIDKVTPDGTVIESYYKREPKAGNNVEVTIDINLQMAAEDELKAKLEALRANENKKADGVDAEGGAVVVMNTDTFEILACASYPSYDPARYFEDYKEILAQDYAPLYNRALQALYPPGSTYKMSMVIAGINSGQINMLTEIEDKGVYRKYAPLTPSCLRWTTHHSTHGSINAMQALCVSCNYFFYELGDMISLNAMDSTAKALGLGESTGVELPEKVGYRANKESKAALHKGDDKRWYPGDQILAAIGQSENRFTPLQLCVYTATLANRGTRYKATFLNRVVSTDYSSLVYENKRELMSHLDITDDAYMAYTQGMRMVVTETTGTAYSAFRNYPIAVSAKTGTAETDNGSDNGAFVCYAPSDDPQIAVVVYGEKAGHGSSMAGIARSILDLYFEVGEIGDIDTFENQFS